MQQPANRKKEIACITELLKGLSDKDVHMILALVRAFDKEAKEK